jgi:hypothetical protein
MLKEELKMGVTRMQVIIKDHLTHYPMLKVQATVCRSTKMRDMDNHSALHESNVLGKAEE